MSSLGCYVLYTTLPWMPQYADFLAYTIHPINTFLFLPSYILACLQWQPSFLIAFINAASLCPLHKNVSEKQLFYLSYTRGRCTLAWGINSTYLSYSFVLRLSILYLIAQKIWWKKDKSWQYLWCCSHVFKKKHGWANSSFDVYHLLVYHVRMLFTEHTNSIME